MTPSEVAALLALVAHTSASAPDASDTNVRSWVHALHDVRLVEALHACAGLIDDRTVITSGTVAERIEADLRARVAAANRPDDPDTRDRRYRHQFHESVASGHLPVPGPRGDDVQTLTDDALGGWCSYCKAKPTERCHDPRFEVTHDDGTVTRSYVRVPHACRIRDRRRAREQEAQAPEPVALEAAPAPVPTPAAAPADDPWSQLEGDPR